MRNALRGIEAREVITIWSNGEVERWRAHVHPEGTYGPGGIDLPVGVEPTPEIIDATARWLRWLKKARQAAACATWELLPSGVWRPTKLNKDIWLEVDGLKFSVRVPGRDAKGYPLKPRIYDVPPSEAFGLPAGMIYDYPAGVESPGWYGIECT